MAGNQMVSGMENPKLCGASVRTVGLEIPNLNGIRNTCLPAVSIRSVAGGIIFHETNVYSQLHKSVEKMVSIPAPPLTTTIFALVKCRTIFDTRKCDEKTRRGEYDFEQVS